MSVFYISFRKKFVDFLESRRREGRRTSSTVVNRGPDTDCGGAARLYCMMDVRLLRAVILYPAGYESANNPERI